MAILPVEKETTEAEVVFDLFEVKRRDEPKAGPRRCRVAMPVSGPAAILQMVPIDAEAARAAPGGTGKLAIIKEEMVRTVRGMPEGITTTEPVPRPRP
jgi:hypothetical protein